MSQWLNRAAGCLAGVALGDALGRATEFMTRQEIRERFGWLREFAAPRSEHPGSGDPLGAITDDTEQTLLIARVLASGDALTPERVAAAFVEWAKKGSSPYLGPSTRKALAQLLEGASPYETGRQGTTNGAAMRVAPIGIIHRGDLDGAVRDAAAASIPTHNTHNAIQGAAAVACAVAAAMAEHTTVDRIVQAAQEGARTGRSLGGWSWATPLEKRIELAVQLVRQAPTFEQALESLYDFVGAGLDPAESVASAIGVVAAASGDPTKAILGGVNIGGDTDTIAAMAGGICGAWHGIDALDAGWVQQVEQVNRLNFRALAQDLLSSKEH